MYNFKKLYLSCLLLVILLLTSLTQTKMPQKEKTPDEQAFQLKDDFVISIAFIPHRGANEEGLKWAEKISEELAKDGYLTMNTQDCGAIFGLDFEPPVTSKEFEQTVQQWAKSSGINIALFYHFEGSSKKGEMQFDIVDSEKGSLGFLKVLIDNNIEQINRRLQEVIEFGGLPYDKPDNMVFVNPDSFIPYSYGIDKWEYPATPGKFPVVVVSWYQAEELCENHGKRLCTYEEWLNACKKGENPPINYKFKCQIAKKQFSGALRIGASSCVNSQGLYDLIGNIQEWVIGSNREGPQPVVGGFWLSKESQNCNSPPLMLDPRFSFPHTGFRCCK